MDSFRAWSFVKHLAKSIGYYRLTALYLVSGIALTTAHAPLTYSSPPPALSQAANHSVSGVPLLFGFHLDIGEPPWSIFRIAHITIAAWFAFLGAFWDVRRRMKEWSLLRLYGGHPSLVAGFHFFCLSLLGILAGGGFALFAGPSHSLDEACCLLLGTLGWGFLFSICVCVGPVVYTEFCDVVAVLRADG